MEAILKNAYTEVNQIIELLGEEYKTQIPQKLLNLFNEKQNPDYKTNISNDIQIDKIEVSRTALIIISILNLRYWEKDETKKAELKSIYDENEKKFQEKISGYKHSSTLKIDKNNIFTEENKQEKAIIKQKDISWIVKLRKFFSELIHLGRKRER